LPSGLARVSTGQYRTDDYLALDPRGEPVSFD